MKAAVILALPALALAAATPQVQERQLPGLPLDPTCLLRITGITRCVPGGVSSGTVLTDLLGWYVVVKIIQSCTDPNFFAAPSTSSSVLLTVSSLGSPFPSRSRQLTSLAQLRLQSAGCWGVSCPQNDPGPDFLAENCIMSCHSLFHTNLYLTLNTNQSLPSEKK